jgi:hypothetical protein
MIEQAIERLAAAIDAQTEVAKATLPVLQTLAKHTCADAPAPAPAAPEPEKPNPKKAKPEPEPEPEKPKTKKAKPEPEPEPAAEEKLAALRQLCREKLSADPSKKSVLEAIGAEFGVTGLPDLKPEQLDDFRKAVEERM